MTQPKGSKDAGRSPGSASSIDDQAEKSALIPDLFRRAFTLGLSGIFTTEEAFRRALGDTVPQDWVDFAVDQSDRTRTEFSGRMAEELGRILEATDLGEVLAQLLANHTVEVKAEFRLVPTDEVTTDAKGEKSSRSRASATVSMAKGGKRK
jgi:hypothetical protein